MKYSDRHISDEELDQLFRDAHASEGPEALFVPEFWSEMEAMLPAEKKKKRAFYWIPLAATVVLFGIILFYPSSPAKVDRLTQEKKQIENESKGEHEESSTLYTVKNETENDESRLLSGEHEENLSAFNTKGQASPSQGITKPKFKRTFIPQTNTSHHELDNQLAEEVPLNLTNGNRENPEDKAVILNQEIDSNPHSHSASHSELDSVILEARYEAVPHEEIAALPKDLSNESSEWYAELGPTLGQSPYLSKDQKRNVASGVVFGGGYIKRIDNAFVSFGLQARMEGFGGLEYRETNFSQNIVRTVSVKQLYSLEIPLKFGYSFKRSEFALGVTPGVQLFIHGKERITENQVVQRENTFTGKVEHSNSLTMEFGLQYYYNFTSRFGLGAKVNADILRPFHTDYYLGKTAGLPVNGQIVFRMRFSR